MASSTTRTRPMRAAWMASGACTSGSTGRRGGGTRRAAPTTRSAGSAATTSTTTQTAPANNQLDVDVALDPDGAGPGAACDRLPAGAHRARLAWRAMGGSAGDWAGNRWRLGTGGAPGGGTRG